MERRIAPVGFLEGPAAVPVHLFLKGAARGAELASARAGVTTIQIVADGPIHPLGVTEAYGRLQVVGDTETGVLVLDAPKSTSTLAVKGTVGGPLAFTIAHGMAAVPNTTWDYALEIGAGTVSISSSGGAGRTPVTLTFTS